MYVLKYFLKLTSRQLFEVTTPLVDTTASNLLSNSRVPSALITFGITLLQESLILFFKCSTSRNCTEGSPIVPNIERSCGPQEWASISDIFEGKPSIEIIVNFFMEMHYLVATSFLLFQQEERRQVILLINSERSVSNSPQLSLNKEIQAYQSSAKNFTPDINTQPRLKSTLPYPMKIFRRPEM